MKVFKVVYKSTGITQTRLMVADSSLGAFELAEEHKLAGESILTFEDISGDLSVYIQEDLRIEESRDDDTKNT